MNNPTWDIVIISLWAPFKALMSSKKTTNPSHISLQKTKHAWNVAFHIFCVMKVSRYINRMGETKLELCYNSGTIIQPWNELWKCCKLCKNYLNGSVGIKLYKKYRESEFRIPTVDLFDINCCSHSMLATPQNTTCCHTGIPSSKIRFKRW